MTLEPSAASPAGAFTWIDGAIVIGYLAFTTVVGGLLAGKQSSIRDFFLGGRKLPWYAVSASIIATEISAVTFVSLPYVVFQNGGNFTYLQLGLFGSVLARVIVGFVFVPVYYRREIYSPYDYMGQQLGGPARSVTTVLFTLGGVLAQSARVYLTAVVLELILGDALFGRLSQATGLSTMTWSIWTIGLIAVVWTWMGGITTVIWTDFLLFLMFLAGALAALGFVCHVLPGGFGELLSAGRAGGKFRFFDFSPDPTRAYTFWAALIANTWFCTGMYGTDQLMAQRMFCCRGPKQARWAVLSSSVGLVVTVTIMLVGVGLYAYYQAHPLTGETLRLYQEKGDRIFPLFILHVLPTGMTGIVVAAIFAAAISSLDSILAALSQTAVSAFYIPWRRRKLKGGTVLGPSARMVPGPCSASRGAPHGPAPSRRAGTPLDRATQSAAPLDRATHSEDADEMRQIVWVSRAMVLVWGVVLCLMAQLAAVAAKYYASILDLALAMAGYTSGALLAGFLLAFLPWKVDGRGLCWSGPISVATVFALVWHQPAARWICWGFALAVLALWTVLETRGRRSRAARRTLWLLVGLALMLIIHYFGYGAGPPDVTDLPTYRTLAWPWYAPVGCVVAVVFGCLLSGRRERNRV